MYFPTIRHFQLRKPFYGLLLALGFVLFFGGCTKGVPEFADLDQMVARSRVIYIAEKENGEYRIARILKCVPEERDAFVVGHAAELVAIPPGVHVNRDIPLIIFFEKKSFNSQKRLDLIQTELPIMALKEYKISYEDFLAKVSEPAHRQK